MLLCCVLLALLFSFFFGVCALFCCRLLYDCHACSLFVYPCFCVLLYVCYVFVVFGDVFLLFVFLFLYGVVSVCFFVVVRFCVCCCAFHVLYVVVCLICLLCCSVFC